MHESTHVACGAGDWHQCRLVLPQAFRAANRIQTDAREMNITAKQAQAAGAQATSRDLTTGF